MTKGLTASTFDLLHSGHVKMLEQAKQKCDYLIVGLHVDPSIERKEKNKPIQNVVERYTQLKALKYVDEIIPYTTEQELLDILQLNEIQIRIIGEEYKDKDFTGKAYCDSKNIEMYYNSREHRFSSSELRARTYGNNDDTVTYDGTAIYTDWLVNRDVYAEFPVNWHKIPE